MRRQTSCDVLPRRGMHEDGRHDLALLRDELQGLVIARIENRERLERVGRLADADDDGAVVVHLEDPARRASGSFGQRYL